jgi:hypothetical protein
VSTWTREEAIELCRLLEAVVPTYGCHIALTGGLLYKDGLRKDADIMFYRIRQAEAIAWEAMWDHLEILGLEWLKGEEGHWCIKASWHGKPVDCFFPEADLDNYYEEEPAEEFADLSVFDA